MHQINISHAVNGIIVNVGCKTFVFTDISKGFKEMERYYRNPRKVEAEYRKNFPQLQKDEVLCCNELEVPPTQDNDVLVGN